MAKRLSTSPGQAQSVAAQHDHSARHLASGKTVLYADPAKENPENHKAAAKAWRDYADSPSPHLWHKARRASLSAGRPSHEEFDVPETYWEK